MLFCSHASELALRAAIHLALQPPGKLSPVREIASGTGLPAPYLSKIMRQLIRAGLVRAVRGPGGGVELSQPPAAIGVAAVVKAVEGESDSEKCILGLGACSEAQPCPLHLRWVPMRREIRRMLEETSLATLAAAARERPEFLVRAGAVQSVGPAQNKRPAAARRGKHLA
jgi:Rrf2 family protein